MYEESVHRDLYQYMKSRPGASLVPGGSGQNAAKIAGSLLQDCDRIAFFGCVGGNQEKGDEFATTMQQTMLKSNVACHYQYSDQHATGVSAVNVNEKTRDRSLCTRLGASQDFDRTYFWKNQASLVDKCKILFLTGFFATASAPLITVGHSAQFTWIEHAKNMTSIMCRSLLRKVTVTLWALPLTRHSLSRNTKRKYGIIGCLSVTSLCPISRSGRPSVVYSNTKFGVPLANRGGQYRWQTHSPLHVCTLGKNASALPWLFARVEDLQRK